VLEQNLHPCVREQARSYYYYGEHIIDHSSQGRIMRSFLRLQGSRPGHFWRSCAVGEGTPSLFPPSLGFGGPGAPPPTAAEVNPGLPPVTLEKTS